jgi:hypothetical protein
MSSAGSYEAQLLMGVRNPLPEFPEPAYRLSAQTGWRHLPSDNEPSLLETPRQGTGYNST